jgi:hypothetical protein
MECDRFATDEEKWVTYSRHHIKENLEGKPQKFGYELLCCTVIWALPQVENLQRTAE